VPCDSGRRRADEDRARPPRWRATAKTALPGEQAGSAMWSNRQKNTTRTPGGPDSTSPSPRGYGECPARTSMLWGLALRPRRKGGKCSNSQWRSLLREDKKRTLANHQRCHKFSP
jgi:hypothetical protein